MGEKKNSDNMRKNRKKINNLRKEKGKRKKSVKYCCSH